MTSQITKALITWCKEGYLICSLVCPWIKSLLDEGYGFIGSLKFSFLILVSFFLVEILKQEISFWMRKVMRSLQTLVLLVNLQ